MRFLENIWVWVTLRTVSAELRNQIFRLIHLAAEQLPDASGREKREFVIAQIMQNPVLRSRLPDEWYVDVLIKTAVALLSARGEI